MTHSALKQIELHPDFPSLQERFKSLSFFIRLNHKAFAKITKKFDKATNESTMQTFVKMLSSQAFVDNYMFAATSVGEWAYRQSVSKRDKCNVARVQQRKYGFV